MSPREIILALLDTAEHFAADNLARAKYAARGRDTTKPYGESGVTLGEFIVRYEERLREVRSTRRWFIDLAGGA